MLAASYCYTQSPACPCAHPGLLQSIPSRDTSGHLSTLESGHIPPCSEFSITPTSLGEKSHSSQRFTHSAQSPVLTSSHASSCSLPSSLRAFSLVQPQSPCIGCVLCHQITALPPPPHSGLPSVSHPLFPVPLVDLTCFLSLQVALRYDLCLFVFMFLAHLPHQMSAP